MKLISTALTLAASLMVMGLPALSGSATPLNLPTNAPRLRAGKPPSSRSVTSGWASSNWSGYALSSSTTGAYHSITGQWIVPTVKATRRSTYSSSWIGIDGFNNSSLIQTGTEQDYASGHAQYYAWWEILPASETEISPSSYPVQPGDHMSASITNDGGGTWTITLSDTTAGWTFSTNQAYSGPGTSAEWIEEAPTIGGTVAKLAHYGQTTFNPGTVNGGNPALVSSESGVMIQKQKQVSTPSLPDSDTDGFNVAYGSTAPTPPAS